MKRIIVAAALCVVCLAGCRNDALEIADVNAWNAIAKAEELSGRVEELASR